MAITLRENPLVWKNTWTAIAYQDGKVYRTRSYEVEIVDRLGAGDSFAAGLIHGLLDGDLQKGRRFRRRRQRHQALDPRRLRLDHPAGSRGDAQGGRVAD